MALGVEETGHQQVEALLVWTGGAGQNDRDPHNLRQTGSLGFEVVLVVAALVVHVQPDVQSPLPLAVGYQEGEHGGLTLRIRRATGSRAPRLATDSPRPG